MKAGAHCGSGFLYKNVCMTYHAKLYKIKMLRQCSYIGGILTSRHGGSIPSACNGAGQIVRTVT